MAGSRTGGGAGCPLSMKVDGSRAEYLCANLINLISYAYRMSPARISAPEWMSGMSSPRFDIVAKIPEGGAERQAREMVQALLAERFRLVTHRAGSQQTMYALVLAKGGLKMAASNEAESDPVEETSDSGHTQRWESPSISFERLADLLDRAMPLDAPVIDETGVSGNHRLALEITLNDLPGYSAPLEMENTVLARFNEGLGKLGLRIERRRGTVDMLVVDHAEKAPIGN